MCQFSHNYENLNGVDHVVEKLQCSSSIVIFQNDFSWTQSIETKSKKVE